MCLDLLLSQGESVSPVCLSIMYFSCIFVYGTFESSILTTHRYNHRLFHPFFILVPFLTISTTFHLELFKFILLC